MADNAEKQTITWEQLETFAKAIDRDVTHVYRVVAGKRDSDPIAEAFERHFGFPMAGVEFAGRKPLGNVA